MAGKKKGKEKYPLLFATIVAFLTVCTAGVSTFAWFQANAHVNISATSTDTTITVSKPDDFVFYGYKGNTASDWSNKHESFANDFEQITSSNLTAKTSFTGQEGSAGQFNPGETKVFALQFTNHKLTDRIYLEIQKLISNTYSDQTNTAGKQRIDKSAGLDINIGWAIDIRGAYVNTTTPAPSVYAPILNQSLPAIAGTPLGANQAGTQGVSYYTRAVSNSGSGYLNDGTYAYTLVNSIPNTHAANVYYPLTFAGFTNNKSNVAAVAGTALAANAPGSEGVTYYTRVANGSGAGYLNDGTYLYTPVTSIPETHAAGTYYPLTNVGYSATDRFQVSSSEQSILTSSSKRDKDNSTKELTLKDGYHINVFNAASNTINERSGLIFFTIEFCDELVNRYREVISSSNDDSVLIPSTADLRYFRPNTGSVDSPLYNSNCYAGLTFALTLMEFKF